MQVVSLTEARNNLKSVFDSVYLDNDEVVIHRKGNENVVMISMTEYNAMKEINKKKLLVSQSLAKEESEIKAYSNHSANNIDEWLDDSEDKIWN